MIAFGQVIVVCASCTQQDNDGFTTKESRGLVSAEALAFSNTTQSHERCMQLCGESTTIHRHTGSLHEVLRGSGGLSILHRPMIYHPHRQIQFAFSNSTQKAQVQTSPTKRSGEFASGLLQARLQACQVVVLYSTLVIFTSVTHMSPSRTASLAILVPTRSPFFSRIQNLKKSEREAGHVVITLLTPVFHRVR